MGSSVPGRVLSVATIASSSVLLNACTDRPPALDVEDTATIQAIERWRLGGFAEEGGLVLGAPPVSGALSPSGWIAFLEDGVAAIPLLDPDGEVAAVLGGPGGGPGEFRRPDRIGFESDSVVWISDVMQGRITWLGTDGEVLRTEPQPREQVAGTPWSARPTRVLADGRLLGVADGQESDIRGRPLPRPMVLWSQNGEMEVIGTIESEAPWHREIRMADGRSTMSSHIIPGEPIVGVARGGDWFFVLDRTPSTEDVAFIHITRYDATGTILDELEVPYHPLPVGDEVMDRLALMSERLADVLPPELGITANAVMQANWIPERMPPVHQAFADEEGFWIRRERWRSPTVWERLDLEGRRQFRIELPIPFEGLAVSPSSVLGWQVDSLQVPFVRMFEIDH